MFTLIESASMETLQKNIRAPKWVPVMGTSYPYKSLVPIRNSRIHRFPRR